ncbi:FMP27, GFWDK domain-containing protein [Artemisia annua]|uniref:FMP27, GFWDK domain-containing protein n=1 Tax=Artemisia annua TaxID=35608 RepID=A0A2U1P6F1_ARTAN|nr:FMP27, GFWDK domain-containing protein [Artemisia annua]
MISDSNATEPSVKWDYVIQGLDMHICLPFRLQLRAIDDSIGEMIRALKLVAAAKKKIILPVQKENESSGANTKPKKSSSSKLGRVELYVRKLTDEIEEEPLQGWLDEHYHLRIGEFITLTHGSTYLHLKLKNNKVMAAAVVRTAV